MAALLPHARPVLLVALAIYLAGVATPLFVLRSLARDRNDSCFLSAMLLAVLLVLIVSLILAFV